MEIAALLAPRLATLAMVVPEHFGALHGYAKLIVMLVAIGPFLVLGAVIYVVRKHDIAAEEAEAAGAAEAAAREQGGDQLSG